MVQLPQELLIEILLWLPVKSLLRFRSVSKSLRRVIDSPDFIKSHLCKSSENFNLRKLIFQEKIGEKEMFHVCEVNIHEIQSLQKPVSSSWKQFLWREVPWKLVLGHCKGLLLLAEGEDFKLSLWNPSTRQHRDLPDCPFECSPNDPLNIVGGLGYDDSIDDFKAFLFVELSSGIQVFIFGLKSNIWIKPQNSGYFFDIDPFFLDMGGFTFTSDDGSMHWLCAFNTNNTRQTQIVAFDMRKKTLSLVPQPVCSNEPIVRKLHVLEGCLCISYCYMSLPYFSHLRSPPQVDLYMREKNGVDQFTWTKLFSVTEPYPHPLHVSGFEVLGYSKRGEKILLHFGEGYIVSYDLKQKCFDKVETYNDPHWRDPILCLESLVSVRDVGNSTSDI